MQKKIVRVVEIDTSKVTLIDDNALGEIIRKVMSPHLKGRRVTMPYNRVKSIIYDLVIKEIRSSKCYYKNLNIHKILNNFKRVFEGYSFVVKESNTSNISVSSNPENELKMYDDLCVLKANGLDYDMKKYQSLRKKFLDGRI